MPAVHLSHTYFCGTEWWWGNSDGKIQGNDEENGSLGEDVASLDWNFNEEELGEMFR